MTTFIVIAAIIFILIIIARIRGSFIKYKAALNCLMAKSAFAQSDEDLRSTAISRACRILEGMGFSDSTESFEKMSEVEKCSVLALAFAELDVPPPFENETWQFIPRPFIAILNADTAFAAARRHLETTYGVELTF